MIGKRLLLGAIVIASLAGCQMVETADVAVAPARLSASTMSSAKAYMADRLIDPESIKVRNETGYRTRLGDEIICGQWDGKNRMGGYTGYETFYIRIREREVKAFQTSYSADRACTMAAAGSVDLPVSQVPGAQPAG